MPVPNLAQTDPAARLLAAYKPLAGAADELLDPSGVVRPVWRPFIDYLSRMAPGEIAQRFARGDQYLRDAGVFFRQYGARESPERAWPLSHVPVLIDADEWRTICDGLIQRADLLEAVVADLYGENRLAAEGHLPASLIARSPEWLRPLVGLKQRSGRYLHFIAFEIGRGPDGRWWVLGDRVQAPSGAGYALENRVATARVFADFYANAYIHRLAGFFRSFRDGLEGLRRDGVSPVGILTPGRLNDTYFEHAYIARYLGFNLLEGEDLTVQNGEVLVRTIAGLKPISVLWRRIDASYADPLELNEASRLGTPGLVDAVRRGQLEMVNALGAGILETRALLAFLPRLCEELRHEPLALPNIATWWCGQEAEREHVRANARHMMLSSALSTHMPFDASSETFLGGELQAEGTLDAMLDGQGSDLVGQEAVMLSTTPALVDGVLTPRPMNLRIFLARTRDGWHAMPGGYARIGRTNSAVAVAMQRGGAVADMWVVGAAPQPTVSLLPSATTPYVRAQLATLPSRAADNLFWLGRYVERAEGLIRLLRAWHIRLAESARSDAPLLRHAAASPGFVGEDPADGVPQGLTHALAAATASASQVRDRFSLDGWTALNDLAASAAIMLRDLPPGAATVDVLNVLLRKIAGFSGLVHDNMYRFAGWRFLSIGRSLERAFAMAQALAWFAAPGSPDGALDFVVEVGDSSLSHRRLYAVAASRNSVIDILACDAMNPRSILFHITDIRDQVSFLPTQSARGHLPPLARAVLKVHSGLAILAPESIDNDVLNGVAASLRDLSDLLTSTYLR